MDFKDSDDGKTKYLDEKGNLVGEISYDVQDGLFQRISQIKNHMIECREIPYRDNFQTPPVYALPLNYLEVLLLENLLKDLLRL